MLNQINHDLKNSMKNKESIRVGILREMKNVIHGLGSNADENEEIKAIQKLAKQQEESIEDFKKGNRNDLVKKAEKELDIINEYLPKQLSQGEIEEVVEKIIADLNITQLKDMKSLMAEAENRLGNSADNKTIANIAKDKLGTQ